MAVWTSEIETHTPDWKGRLHKVPVIYADELKETSVYDLASNSVQGGYLPYLFTGYFSEGEKFHKWYIANARRHEEMKEAVEANLGREMDYAFGQIWFAISDYQRGELLFDRLFLHTDLPNRERVIRELIDSIKSDYMAKYFEVTTITGGRTNRPDWTYIFDKNTGQLRKIL